MNMTSDCHGQFGVTLVELLVTLGMTLTTVAAIYTIHLVQLNHQRVQEDRMAMQQTIRAATDMMTREIRIAGYDPSGLNSDEESSNDFFGVTYDPTALRLQADLNGNGLLSDSNETIVYSYDEPSHILRRKVGRGGRQPVAEYMEGFTFQYLDAQGLPTTDSQNIRAVQVQLTGRSEHADSQYPENEGYRTFTLRSRIVPRNLQGR